jgi:hypothetical protein
MGVSGPPDWEAAPRRIKAADVFVSLASFPRDDTHRVLLKVWPGTALVFFSCSWCRLNAVTGAPGLLCGLPPCRPTSSRLRRSSVSRKINIGSGCCRIGMMTAERIPLFSVDRNPADLARAGDDSGPELRSFGRRRTDRGHAPRATE